MVWRERNDGKERNLPKLNGGRDEVGDAMRLLCSHHIISLTNLHPRVREVKERANTNSMWEITTEWK